MMGIGVRPGWVFLAVVGLVACGGEVNGGAASNVRGGNEDAGVVEGAGGRTPGGAGGFVPASGGRDTTLPWVGPGTGGSLTGSGGWDGGTSSGGTSSGGTSSGGGTPSIVDAGVPWDVWVPPTPADAGVTNACVATEPGDPCGGATFHGNAVIQSSDDIAALSGFTHLDGNLEVHGFSGKSLAGLEGLRCVGLVKVDTNPNLESLDGLGCLVTLSDLIILHNPKLASLRALGSAHGPLTNLQIEDDPKLASLEGLEGISSIGYLNLFTSPIESLLPLRNGMPTTVMQIDHTRLRDLHGLEALVSMSSIFAITSNADLVSLRGLENLTSTGWFIISGNGQLPQCEVDRVHAHSATAAGGSVLTSNNGPAGTCADGGAGAH